MKYNSNKKNSQNRIIKSVVFSDLFNSDNLNYN